MLHVTIDDVAYTLCDGASTLDALRGAGAHVPTLCHDDRLAPTGMCRSCLVRVDGASKPQPACTTVLRDGMRIDTRTADLRTYRHSLLEMVTRGYPADAARRFPDKPLHRELRREGLIDSLPDGEPHVSRRDDSHPYVVVDMDRCILCYRCVRICTDVQGQDVWHIRGRGAGTWIEPDGATLRDSPCVSCGACVDACPTGALEDRTASALQPASQWTRTVCPYCGVGCELSVGTRADRIVSIKPVIDSPVSKGHLCVKGRYAFDFVAAPDRITSPMIREAHGWRRVSWNEARAFVAARVTSLIERYGPDSIGILGSARATNEDNYVTQKFARTVIGTNNVDCCARVCHAPSAVALKRMLGAGLATNSYDDIERARTILICGANATESHPVVGARIRQAARRGAHLVVIDPRRTELADCADVHLAIRPGTNVAVLNAMAHGVLSNDLGDRDYLTCRVDGLAAFESFIAAWTPERAARIAGVNADDISRAATLYAVNGPSMSLHGLGLTEHAQGTEGVMALINLALLTGNIGKCGSGVNPLRGQNNVQGAAHMGCDPAMLPGSIPLDLGRGTFEPIWGTAIPTTRGLTMLQMMDAAAAGRMKGLWAVGYDVLMTNADATATDRALASLDLVVVQDMFLTETARAFGSVFLPACSSFEKDGTFMNAERRIQRVRAALPPLGASKPDWQIVAEVSRAMGASGFGYTSAEHIWDEVRTACAGARGMTYPRLADTGLQWPCPAADHPGTALLHEDTFSIGSRAALQCIDYQASEELPSPEFPFQLMTGRSLYQFNAGTMTGRTANTALRPVDVLDISPEDARGASIDPGQRVRVTSRYGSVILPAHIDAAVQRGQLFATFHRPDPLVNRVTGPHRDPLAGTPEYKVTAVRIERLSA